MKLACYVIKTVFLAMIAGVLSLWLLQAVFGYLAELEKLHEGYTAIHAFWYSVYRLPYFFGQVVGTGVLLGSVVGLGLLSNNSEIVVMRSAGVSLHKIVGFAMLPACVFVVALLVVNECLLPRFQLLAKTLKNPDETSFVLYEFWAVVPTQTGRQLINIKQADAQGHLQQVRGFEFDKDKLVQVWYASDGVYQNNYRWMLNHVQKIELTHTVKTDFAEQLSMTLPIDRQSVYLLTKQPQDLSLSDLYAHKQLMNHQQTHSKRHQLAFWQKLLSPLSILSLLILACSFVFGSLRMQTLGFRVVIALFVGLLFSYVSDLVGFIALASDLPAMPMVLLPSVIGAVLGVYLLNKKS